MKKLVNADSRTQEESSGNQNSLREQESSTKQPLTQIKLLAHYDELNLSKEHKYPAMAIHHMLKVLINPNLRDHHKVCLDSIRYIVKN
jgi:hypothetical protein